MQAVKWMVAKLQGFETAFFLQGNEWWRSYKEINRHPSLPWNYITHGFLDPSAFPDKNCPPVEVCGTNVYGNSLFKYTERGDKTSQYPYLVAILSNWVLDNWVYRSPILSHFYRLFANFGRFLVTCG